jgi:hypothetical protein
VNASQRETFRHCLLEVAEANGTRWGLGAEAFAVLVRRFGFPTVTPAETERELVYLADRGLLAEVDKAISPEIGAWRITATGRDLLARGHE